MDSEAVILSAAKDLRAAQLEILSAAKDDNSRSDVNNADSLSRERAMSNTRTASARPISLWRNRDFLLLWSGQIVSAIGSQVSLLAFPWLVLAVTRSPAQAGLIAATLYKQLRSVPRLSEVRPPPFVVPE